MARLNLPKSEYAAVYRAMVHVLRADPIVSKAVKTLLSWEGKPTDAQTLAIGMAPAIRITPTGGPEEWHCPASMVGPLYLNLEILVQGYDADDLMNLWRAVAAAYYDPQATTFAAIQATLRSAGAYPPSPQFTAPAFDAKPESDFLFSLSQIKIMVQTQLGSRGVNST
jgi:hypothetical protein